MVYMDYILGKINMLALAFGLFAVFTFYVSTLQPRTCENIANNIALNVLNEVSGVGGSQSICFESAYTIPRIISCQGQTGETGVFYKIVLRVFESTSNPGLYTYQVKLVSRNDNKVLGAKSIDLRAKPRFFDWSPKSVSGSSFGSLKEITGFPLEVELDPQLAPFRKDTFKEIKDRFNGEDLFFLFPCTSSGGTLAVCDALKKSLGCKIAQERLKDNASCFGVLKASSECS